MKYRPLVLIGLCFLLIFGFSFQPVWALERTITITGMADIAQVGLAQAEDIAISDALRQAVEKVVGVYIDSQTHVQNYQQIKDSILIEAQGYVADYQVLESWIDQGIYMVEVKAIVRDEQVKQDLDSLQLTLKRAGNPRILVAVSEVHLEQPVLDSVAETELIHQLLKVGFKVMDQKQVELAQETEVYRRALTGDVSAYQQLGSEYGADILIIGEAFSELASIYHGFFTCQARVEIRAVRTDTGEILAALSAHAKAVDISESISAKKALTQAGQVTAKDLLEILPKELTDVERTLQLSVSQVTFSDIAKLQEFLTTVPLIEGVYLREFVGNIVRIDLETSLLPIQLAEILSKSNEIALEVTGFSGSKIELIKKETKNWREYSTD